MRAILDDRELIAIQAIVVKFAGSLCVMDYLPAFLLGVQHAWAQEAPGDRRDLLSACKDLAVAMERCRMASLEFNQKLAEIGERQSHADEAARIRGELDRLTGPFAPDGVVRTVLRERIKQERALADSSGREGQCSP